MSKVVIRQNGSYNCDTLEVVYPDGTTAIFEFKLYAKDLRWVLEKLGHKVEVVDFKFDTDED